LAVELDGKCQYHNSRQRKQKVIMQI